MPASLTVRTHTGGSLQEPDVLDVSAFDEAQVATEGAADAGAADRRGSGAGDGGGAGDDAGVESPRATSRGRLASWGAGSAGSRTSEGSGRWNLLRQKLGMATRAARGDAGGGAGSGSSTNMFQVCNRVNEGAPASA